MPLYCLCVPTNVGHVTVATFLLSDDRQESTEAGLRQIAMWNTHWKPTHFVTDINEGQIGALKSAFLGTFTVHVH